MFALLILLGSLLCVNADNSTDVHQCKVLKAAVSTIEGYLLLGNRYVYAQHRFGPPIIAEKCWSSSFFVSDFNILDNSLNPILTFFDPREKHRYVQTKLYVIENKAKWYMIYDGQEIIVTNFIFTPEYTVAYFCRGNEHSVVIATAQKKRDEKVIQKAIEEAKKIISLPSPSVNMECDELVRET